MRRRPLGSTGLEVTELSLGTWGLSGDGYGPMLEGEAERVIDRALAIGVNLFETADSYGFGSMERLLGQRLKSHPKALVATKLGTDLDGSPPRKRFDAAYLRRAFEVSQERLDRERVDIVLLHNPSARALQTDEPTGVLEELRAGGRIAAWGVSASTEEVARLALDRGAQVLGVPHNVLVREPLQAVAARIREQNIGVLAHSVLSYGLLCGLWPRTKTFRYGDHRNDRWSPAQLAGRLRQLDAVRPLVSGDVRTLRAAAVRFVLSEELVSSAVLGPRTGTQLDQLVREAGQEPPYLSAAKLSALDQRLDVIAENG